MTLPALPSQGSTTWYAWASAVHDAVTAGGTVPDGSVTDVKVSSSAAISADKLADGTTLKVLTATERTKLAGIATGATAYTDEMARDALGTALVAGTNVTITPNDAGDTITIAATSSSGSSNERLMQGFYPVKAWTFDPLLASFTQALTSGTVYVGRIIVTPGDVLTGHEHYVTTAGSGITLAKGGLYLADGTFLRATADQSATWTGTGRMTAAYTSTYTVPAGVTSLYATLIYVGTTAPTVARANSASVAGIVAMNMSSGVRFGVRSGQTDLPSPLGTVTASNLMLLQTVV